MEIFVQDYCRLVDYKLTSKGYVGGSKLTCVMIASKLLYSASLKFTWSCKLDFLLRSSIFYVRDLRLEVAI